ncbi:hypothetical protein Tsubulata_004133 [Turnera subulata]|uniref:Uncharacterized protein n=1 Tax=Turnera subulata TaxID=218843 RepID=A0A9Q0IZD5_9ROSI|nr:hypothetical protein Tsubulata_004133 [Turnera subulata]
MVLDHPKTNDGNRLGAWLDYKIDKHFYLSLCICSTYKPEKHHHNHHTHQSVLIRKGNMARTIFVCASCVVLLLLSTHSVLCVPGEPREVDSSDPWGRNINSPKAPGLIEIIKGLIDKGSSGLATMLVTTDKRKKSASAPAPAPAPAPLGSRYTT